MANLPTWSSTDISACAEAGAPWNDHREFPDVVRWADITFAPGLAKQVLSQRMTPTRSHTIPAFKESGGMRRFTVLDPFDEVAYRLFVGRICVAADRALGTEVLSYRLTEGPPGWRVQNHRYVNRVRRAEALQFVDDEDFGGLGVFDVRDYYPSLSIGSMLSAMAAAGVRQIASSGLAGWLARLESTWDTKGLTIGPEASGILGNIGLVRLDSVLRASGYRFHRYTDDITVYMATGHDWSQLVAIVENALGELGLALNRDGKLKNIRTRGIARRHISDPLLDSLSSALDRDQGYGLKLTRLYFDSEVKAPRPKGRRLRFMLKVLQSAHDPHGATAAIAEPTLIDRAPRHWGDYLRDLNAHRAIDRDWLFSLATAPVTPTAAARQFHLLRAAGTGGLTREQGERIASFAFDGDLAEWSPLRALAADAWATSPKWRPGRAAELAMTSVGEPLLRRALALSLRRATGKRVRKHLQRLRSVPECAPAASWVEHGLRN